MVKFIAYILIILVAFLLVMCGLQRCKNQKDTKRTGRHHYSQVPTTTDTVKVTQIKPRELELPVINPPKIIITQLPDTISRKQAEKGVIIRSMELKKGEKQKKGLARLFEKEPDDTLTIQVITPKGITIERQYPGEWVHAGELEIDSTGQLRFDPTVYQKKEEKKERKKGFKRTLIIIGTTTIVVLTTILLLQ